MIMTCNLCLRTLTTFEFLKNFTDEKIYCLDCYPEAIRGLDRLKQSEYKLSFGEKAVDDAWERNWARNE